MPTFPFSAIVGQDEMRQALLIAAVDPAVGGVLVFGDRGTGKSTAIRALAALLPVARDCMAPSYPELATDFERISTYAYNEEEAFRQTLRAGTTILDLAVALGWHDAAG